MKPRQKEAGVAEKKRNAQPLPRSVQRKLYLRKTLVICASLTMGMGLAALTNPSSSFAELGGNATSVEADRAKMEATLQTTGRQLYTVHEMHAGNSVTVREFVSPAGKVFGVAWEGASRPDMKQLLGTYFDQFTQAAQSRQAKRLGRGPLIIRQPGLVLEMGGHARAFVGRAYVPQMVPAGVNLEELR